MRGVDAIILLPCGVLTVIACVARKMMTEEYVRFSEETNALDYGGGPTQHSQFSAEAQQ
jgi:hypothetical protein